MSSFAAKLVALLLLFSLGVYPATSTLLPNGDKKRPSSHVFDCSGVLRRITARKEGNFGCKNLEAAVEHKAVPSRSLRILLLSPPSPIRNRAKAMIVPGDHLCKKCTDQQELTTLVALLLLFGLGVYPATSTLLPNGNEKRLSSHVFDCRGMLRRITARKEGNFGCENLEAVEHKPEPARSLRSLLVPPPSPIQNRRHAMKPPSKAPPPLIA